MHTFHCHPCQFHRPIVSLKLLQGYNSDLLDGKIKHTLQKHGKLTTLQTTVINAIIPAKNIQKRKKQYCVISQHLFFTSQLK